MRLFGSVTQHRTKRAIKWRARVTIGPKRLSLGLFDTVESAEAAIEARLAKHRARRAARTETYDRQAAKRGVVYFVLDSTTGAVKIGHTADLVGRLSCMEVSASDDRLELLIAIPGGRHLEQAIQQAFESQHLKGEWYRMSPDLRRLIEELSSIYDADGDGTPIGHQGHQNGAK